MSIYNVQQEIDNETYLANRLNSISIFSKGIAHDLNNILTLIRGNITLAKMHVGVPDTTIELLSEADHVCDRAKDLVQQISVISTDHLPNKKRLLISEVVKNTVKFCLKGTIITNELIVEDQIYYVKANEGQIYQVFINLILNAVQAMPDGGELTIKLGNVFIHKNSDLPLNQRHYVKCDITDTGVGIPEENLSKVFNPFFTSKKEGKGLGLAIARSIIHDHNGYISVESRVGVGATFHVYLPAYQ